MSYETILYKYYMNGFLLDVGVKRMFINVGNAGCDFNWSGVCGCFVNVEHLLLYIYSYPFPVSHLVRS